MTTYNWSALANGATINFNPVSDRLVFDDASISAAGVILGTNYTQAILTYGGKTVTLSDNNSGTFEAYRLEGSGASSNIQFANGSLFLFGDNNDTVTGSDDAANTLTGSSLADHLLGAAGNDTLDGAAGNDWLDGMWGNDRLLGSGDNDSLDGASGNDWLDGGAGNDTLHGHIAIPVPPGPGGLNETDFDTLSGGAGDDTYIVTATEDLIVEAAGAGTDVVRSSSATYTLPANIEYLILTGLANINGTGNSDPTVLIGNPGNNVLDGGTGPGADAIHGGAGNDTFILDIAGDFVFEDPGAGIDTVQIAVGGYTLGANVENLTLTGAANVGGTGNTLDNVLTGNGGLNTLTGLAGNDTLDGGAGADTMTGGTGNDTYVVSVAGDVVTEAAGEGTDTVQTALAGYTLGATIENLTLTGAANIGGSGNTLNNVLTGNSGQNTLTGLAGNDTLDGGAGADTLSGGTGDDTYTVDAAGDVVSENPAEGTADLVRSSVNYTLGANVERLELIGTALTGTGNSVNNALTGNTLNNTLSGLAGNDTLDGGSGADTLIGGSENDTLIGGSGVDSLAGGAGNDAYIVSVSVTVGGSRIVFVADDILSESAAQGSDTVYSSSNYTLPSNVENLVLTGAPMWRPYTGTGNELNNTLTGTGAARQRLFGEGGNDTLDGGAGADSLTGGSGADVFLFNTAPSADTVLDFTSGTDDIDLENAIFTAFVATGAVSATRVQVAAEGAISAISGNDADGQDNLKYATDTGHLYYDSNGTAAGGLALIATLYSVGMTPATLLPAQDITIV